MVTVCIVLCVLHNGGCVLSGLIMPRLFFPSRLVSSRCRLDRLRHQLLPVYTYDPTEEVNEAEQEMLWRDEDTKVS